MRQKILITGGAGFIGSHLADELLAHGREVHLLGSFADISHAREVQGYAPRISLEKGVVELSNWHEGQVPVDRVEEASAELYAHWLTV